MSKQYGMVIDTRRCIGCHTCAVACKSENNLPREMWWNNVRTVGGEGRDVPEGEFPNLKIGYLPIACQHCENPACVKACPVGATWKDEETGIVHQDPDVCIGCRMCMAACPYTGVRSFNWEEPQYYIEHATGDALAMHHQKHTVEKCILCSHRVARGEQPACIAPCPGRARHFGDVSDPESEVSALLRSRESMQLVPEAGTHPSVYYLM